VGTSSHAARKAKGKKATDIDAIPGTGNSKPNRNIWAYSEMIHIGKKTLLAESKLCSKPYQFGKCSDEGAVLEIAIS